MSPFSLQQYRQLPPLKIEVQWYNQDKSYLLFIGGCEPKSTQPFQVKDRDAITFRRTLEDTIRIRLLPNFRN